MVRRIEQTEREGRSRMVTMRGKMNQKGWIEGRDGGKKTEKMKSRLWC